jgi:hypothetical protein
MDSDVKTDQAPGDWGKDKHVFKTSCATKPLTGQTLSGYDEPRTLSYQITLFEPISADVRPYN